MASKSGGTVSYLTPVFVDVAQAHAWLNSLHFWSAGKYNSKGQSGVEVNITHAGHRVSATRRTFVEAVNACNEKLKEKDAPKLKLAV